MKVLLISGFLGAGKTTFIKELIQRTGKNFVVLENEYGTVDLDSDELQTDSVMVWELTEGCVCCTVKANFATSIMTIENTLRQNFYS